MRSVLAVPKEHALYLLKQSRCWRSATGLLALLCAQDVSCGGPAPKTCVVPNVSYKGSAAGSAFLKMSSDRGLAISVGGVSFALLTAAVNGTAFCFRTFDSSAEILNARVWVDTSGAAAANCADVSSAACEPSPRDPQASKIAPLRWGEVNLIVLQIAGP